MFDALIGKIGRRNSSEEEGEEEQQEHFGMWPSIENKDYEDKQLNFFADTSSSKYLPGIIAMIEEQDGITESFKRALIKATAQLLGVDELLANNNPRNMGVGFYQYPLGLNSLEADLILWSVVLDAYKCDLDNFNLLGYIRVIKKNYKALQSRTIGKTTERQIMTELKHTFTSYAGQVKEQPEEQKKKKKGIFGF